MSPSLKAWPETRFSAQRRMSLTRLFRATADGQCQGAGHHGGPPMSDFIGSMLSEDFME